MYRASPIEIHPRVIKWNLIASDNCVVQPRSSHPPKKISGRRSLNRTRLDGCERAPTRSPFDFILKVYSGRPSSARVVWNIMCVLPTENIHTYQLG